MIYDADYLAHLHDEQAKFAALATQTRVLSEKLLLNGHATAAAHLRVASDDYEARAKALRLQIDDMPPPASADIDPATTRLIRELESMFSVLRNEGMNG